jgi:hypothetical protein
MNDKNYNNVNVNENDKFKTLMDLLQNEKLNEDQSYNK